MRLVTLLLGRASLGRWLETVLLRLAYGFIQALVGVRQSLSAMRRRALVFTAFSLTLVAIVMVAAIPVTHFLLGPDLKAVAAVEDEAGAALHSAGDGHSHDDTAQGSPFASLGSLNDDSRARSQSRVAAADGTKKETALEHAAKHADPTYVCPMHPDVTSKEPGTCPICGMDLVLMDNTAGEGGTVQISSATMNALGVRTAPVTRRNVYRRVDTVGYITENEHNMKMVSLRTEGWVEKLHVRAVGEIVKKGDLLFELYSPVLVNAQEEYVQALELQNERLIRASEDRLRALGVSDRQIADVRKTRQAKQLVAVYAPQDGAVAELKGREGMQVSPAEPVLSLVDLSTVWLVVDVFERQAEWIQVGQTAQATLPFMPGKAWKGKVEYIYPSVDAKTRSLKVRLRFDNPEMALKPNMYADVRILASPKKEVMTIPKEAVIQIGKEQRVIVALGDGKFIPMPVQTGLETDDVVEITSGLQEGDDVVVSSQFLIDSEASVKAALMRMHQ